MFSPDDTIVALATPPGRAGIAVVRISGPNAIDIARALAPRAGKFEPRRATLCDIVTGRGTLDRAIVTVFAAPASYTGEDVAEISLHGSPLLAREALDASMRLGARLAAPGEFTLRAFLNGRLDLAQAEAVGDLVEAATPLQARAAFDQLQGTLTARIAAIDGELFDLVARLEASVDFPEEGYHFIEPHQVAAGIGRVLGAIEALLGDAARGRLLREGATVAIVGRTNVGKSSLFNRLAGAERAIVTEVPGTTRDLVTETVDLDGFRVTLIDTAGLRDTLDVVEREGVSRARKAQETAALVLVVLDASAPLTDEDRAILSATQANRRVIAWNKTDLANAGTGTTGALPWDSASSKAVPTEGSGEANEAVVGISAATGDGLDDLIRAIGEKLGASGGGEVPAITNLRHIALLERASSSLRDACALQLGQTPEEIVLADLNRARASLEEITGKRTSEDLLEAIFSRFCVGK